jgi:hypothetical protein
VGYSSAGCATCWPHIGLAPHLNQIQKPRAAAKGIDAIAYGGVRGHALAEIDHAKWRLWDGLTEQGIVNLIHLGQWVEAPCFEQISSLKKLAHTLLETIRYLGLNADSMLDYGKRYHAGQRISTGFVESAVNEFIADRMVKKQQMRWNWYTVQRFLDVRMHGLNWDFGTRIPSLAQWLPACL